MYFDLSFFCLCSLKKDTYKSIWKEGISINSEETKKNIRVILLQDQQFTSGEWELSTRESLKTVVTTKMWYEPSEQLKRQGTFYIGSQRLDLHHPITEHKRISPHINLSFLPPLKRKQDASARLSIGLIPRSIALQDTESLQPTHPHFKTALGKMDLNLSLWILELI